MDAVDDVEVSPSSVAHAGDGSVATSLSDLGHAALRRGELHEARQLFQRATAADPALKDAQRGAWLTERRLAQAPRRWSVMLHLLLALVAVMAAAGIALHLRLRG